VQSFDQVGMMTSNTLESNTKWAHAKTLNREIKNEDINMFRITQMNIQNKNFKAKTVDREQNPRIIKKQNIKQNLSLNLTNVRN